MGALWPVERRRSCPRPLVRLSVLPYAAAAPISTQTAARAAVGAVFGQLATPSTRGCSPIRPAPPGSAFNSRSRLTLDSPVKKRRPQRFASACSRRWLRPSPHRSPAPTRPPLGRRPARADGRGSIDARINQVHTTPYYRIGAAGSEIGAACVEWAVDRGRRSKWHIRRRVGRRAAALAAPKASRSGCRGARVWRTGQLGPIQLIGRGSGRKCGRRT